MTVLEVIQRSAEFLQKKQVDSPRLQAELLLAHALRVRRMDLYLKYDRMLSDVELEGARELVKRRGQREPLQQILGSTSFCGLEIQVNRSVLVPRPETELLAELGWTFLQKVSPDSSAPASGLDFGTGSGCLAVALAVHCPAARLVACDNSTGAIEMAKRNAAAHGVESRIEFVVSNGFEVSTSENYSEPEPGGRQYHLVVSNPPYIPSGTIHELQPEVRDYDPRQALDGGEDGLRFYRCFARHAAEWLQPAGRIMLEFGDGQEQPVRKLFEDQNWIVEQIVRDYTRRPRILIAMKRG